MEVDMNHLPSRPERDALLPFVKARLRELSFLAARIRHETATPEAAIEQASRLEFRNPGVEPQHLRRMRM
jgi:hypothetical protein